MKKFLFFLIVIILCLYFGLFRYIKIYSLLNNIEDNYVSVSKYYIYGNHFNIEGNIDISSDVKLVLKSLKNEISYDIFYSNGEFYTSEYINEGIYLDDIPIDDYFVFLKTTDGDQVKYYSLVNDTSYDDISYYTITRNNKNNLINISFSNKFGKNYMMLSVKDSSLPDNYYDVVIDPGHGGSDPGASFSKYTEANLNLDYALELKNKLENIGLKVILTRVDDTYINAYGTNSRTSIPYQVGAKYYISIHLNSTDDKMKYGGVEVYSPNNASLDFASGLATNIVKYADATYSKKEPFKKLKGVYVKTFTSDDIKASVSEAKQSGYNPYPITTDTNYYFMIRETGGFMTGAYVDGRKAGSSKNDYYNSNVGSESYLLELGYINYWPDLNNLVDNKDGYIEGIVNAFIDELKI